MLASKTKTLKTKTSKVANLKKITFIELGSTKQFASRFGKQPVSKQTIACALALSVLTASGCASTVSKITGSEPIGVMAGDRTIAQRLRDGGIEKNALINLYKLDERFKNNARISIDAFHDVVLITGQVPDPHLKQLATDSVKAIREVQLVHNELSVAPQASYQQIVDDGVIKAKIRKDLLLLPYLKDSRVKVVVEQGVVYLMGILSNEETQSVLEVVQNTSGVLRIISLIDIEDGNIPIGDAVGAGGPVVDKTAQANHTLGQYTPSTGSREVLAMPANTPAEIDPTLTPQFEDAQNVVANQTLQKQELQDNKTPVESGDAQLEESAQPKVITRELNPQIPDESE